MGVGGTLSTPPPATGASPFRWALPSPILDRHRSSGRSRWRRIEEPQAALHRFSGHEGQYLTPKNVAVSLSVEAADVPEHFQLVTDEQRLKIGHETADILLAAVRQARDRPVGGGSREVCDQCGQVPDRQGQRQW